MTLERESPLSGSPGRLTLETLYPRAGAEMVGSAGTGGAGPQPTASSGDQSAIRRSRPGGRSLLAIERHRDAARLHERVLDAAPGSADPDAVAEFAHEHRPFYTDGAYPTCHGCGRTGADSAAGEDNDARIPAASTAPVTMHPTDEELDRPVTPWPCAPYVEMAEALLNVDVVMTPPTGLPTRRPTPTPAPIPAPARATA